MSFDPELDPILDDLKRHASLFDFEAGRLGDDVLDVAVNGVKDHFGNQVIPTSALARTQKRVCQVEGKALSWRTDRSFGRTHESGNRR